jgi:hypothetical protein
MEVLYTNELIWIIFNQQTSDATKEKEPHPKSCQAQVIEEVEACASSI